MDKFNWAVALYGVICLAIILIGLRVVFAILQGGDDDSVAAEWVKDNKHSIDDTVDTAIANTESTALDLRDETESAKSELDTLRGRPGEEVSSLTRAISETNRLTAEAIRARRKIEGE